MGVSDRLFPFTAMAPDYYAFYQAGGDLTVGWVSPTAGSVGTYNESVPDSSYDWFTSSGTAAYWIRQSSGDVSLFATKASAPNTRVKVAGSLTPSMGIADANAQSVLLWDGDTLFRVPAAGASAPVVLTTVSPAPRSVAGNRGRRGRLLVRRERDPEPLHRCWVLRAARPRCSLAKPRPAGLFQDATSLYWVDTSSGYRLMRIAK